MEETKLRIRLWGDPVLRKRCRKVEHVSEEVRKTLEEMYLLMKVADGVGLAANQVGLDAQLVVVETEEGVLKLVNPKITRRKGSVKFEEGCLSFPGISCLIKRAEQIWVSCLDEKGNACDLEARGILSIVLQHEIDHINGIVFIERIPFLRRFGLRSQLKAIKKRQKGELSK